MGSISSNSVSGCNVVKGSGELSIPLRVGWAPPVLAPSGEVVPQNAIPSDAAGSR